MADNANAQKTIDPNEEPVFNWEAQEFALYDKGSAWTIYIVLGAVVLIGIFVWLQNWTGVALAVAAAAALISQGHSKPRPVRCVIFQGGVVLNEKPYNFADLKSFWLVGGSHPLVRFERASRFAMSINLPIGKNDPEQIRLYLSKRLPEHEDRGEDVSDRISRWLKF
jgi:hypothetical protein